MLHFIGDFILNQTKALSGSAVSTHAQKIEALRVRLASLEAKAKAAEARARSAAAKRHRADDLRRKILLGAFLLDRLQLDGVRALQVGGLHFSSWLSRDGDRELFGLALLAEGAAGAAPASLHAQPPRSTAV